MTLQSEIAALKALLDERARAAKAGADAAAARPASEEEATGGVDALLAAVGETVEEFGQDIDRFPRLAALAAFAVGLSLGMVLTSRRH